MEKTRTIQKKLKVSIKSKLIKKLNMRRKKIF